MSGFVPANRAVIEPALQRLPDLERLRVQGAQDLAREARLAAPPRHTGFYVRSIKVDGTRVYTDDPFGHLVEWGSVNNPPYAPLRRAASATGLRFVITNR